MEEQFDKAVYKKIKKEYIKNSDYSLEDIEDIKLENLVDEIKIDDKNSNIIKEESKYWNNINNIILDNEPVDDISKIYVHSSYLIYYFKMLSMVLGFFLLLCIPLFLVVEYMVWILMIFYGLLGPIVFTFLVTNLRKSFARTQNMIIYNRFDKTFTIKDKVYEFDQVNFMVCYNLLEKFGGQKIKALDICIDNKIYNFDELYDGYIYFVNAVKDSIIVDDDYFYKKGREDFRDLLAIYEDVKPRKNRYKNDEVTFILYNKVTGQITIDKDNYDITDIDEVNCKLFNSDYEIMTIKVKGQKYVVSNKYKNYHEFREILGGKVFINVDIIND